jgi:hypothetical protein
MTRSTQFSSAAQALHVVRPWKSNAGTVAAACSCWPRGARATPCVPSAQPRRGGRPAHRRQPFSKAGGP